MTMTWTMWGMWIAKSWAPEEALTMPAIPVSSLPKLPLLRSLPTLRPLLAPRYPLLLLRGAHLAWSGCLPLASVQPSLFLVDHRPFLIQAY